MHLKDCWDVFLLFAIPVGGGIPAGVLLARSRGLSWIAMTFLYFLSDVALAIVFEPVMKALIRASKSSPFLTRVGAAMKQANDRTVARYGTKPGPFTLVLIAFGVDPMTGRAVALAQGHGFLTGWAIAITGDLFFFALIMVSTLWLNDVLGNGTWAAVIVMAAMLAVPVLIRRIRDRFRPR